MKPIYVPSGKAKEYGDFAINIYTGCPHECYYCFAPNVLHKDRESFHSNIKPRDGIVEAVKVQLNKEHITDKLIHLCFVCDPYPKGCDCSTTREIIKLIKDSGNHVQILTKNAIDSARDFDLLDGNDWFGMTISCGLEMSKEKEPNADDSQMRIWALIKAKQAGISTWVSCEPVLEPEFIYQIIFNGNEIDRFKIGKLNYHQSNINWAEFGREAEQLCVQCKRDYYIKESLRKEMEAP